MTMQFVGGPSEIWPMNAFPRMSATEAPSFNSSTMDAAGEMVAFIGHAFFAAGPGTSKTVSSAGGKIDFRTGTVSWAAGATATLRVGIQDVITSAGPPVRPVEDWTTGSPPYDDLVRGTDTLSNNTWTQVTISTGSKTIAHGDLIAIVFDLVVLSAGTPSVTVTGILGITSSGVHRPIMTAKTSGSWGATAIIPNVVVTCDDGTLMSLQGALPCTSVTTRTFANNTGTADEYGNIIVPTSKMGVDTLWAAIDPDGDFNLVLYSDALNVTAPTSEQNIACDLNQMAAGSNGLIEVACGQETLAATSAYAVTIQPSSTTAVTMIECAVNAAGHFAFWPGGTGVYKCTRLDASGALATTTTARMLCGVGVNQRDDGAGGSIAYPVAGAMR